MIWNACWKREHLRRCIVVLESLYSMDGDAAPLEEIINRIQKFNTLLVVDEAHATGVIGETGRGFIAGSTSDPARTIVIGTLSKALGAQGGFVCAAQRFVDAILMGRAHLFSTALAPASAAAALESLAIIDDEPERRKRAAAQASYIRSELQRLKIATPSTIGPIVPALIGDEKKALSLSEKLFERGFLVPAVRFPTVKKGEARLRVSVSAGHSMAQCEALMMCLEALCT